MFIELKILPYAIYSFYSKMIFLPTLCHSVPQPYHWQNSLLPRGLKHTWLWGSHQICIVSQKTGGLCLPAFCQLNIQRNIQLISYDIILGQPHGTDYSTFETRGPDRFILISQLCLLFYLYIEKLIRREIGNCLTFYNELKKVMF